MSLLYFDIILELACQFLLRKKNLLGCWLGLCGIYTDQVDSLGENQEIIS